MNDAQVEYQTSKVDPERKPNDRKNDRTKVDRYEVSQLRRKGMSYGRIAKQLGVSKSSVWAAAREVNVAVVRCASLEVGHRVAQEHLDTLAQLRKINENTNQILDGLMEEIAKGGATRERQKDLREIALKASQEIRGQLSLQLETFRTLYDVSSIAEFQTAVLEEVGACEPAVRSRIVERLKRARALRGSVQVRP
jgi:predicted transcriptional regulator